MTFPSGRLGQILALVNLVLEGSGCRIVLSGGYRVYLGLLKRRFFRKSVGKVSDESYSRPQRDYEDNTKR